MFGFFKKKKDQVERGTSSLKEIVFKSNRAAFEYACQYFKDDISLDIANVGIVELVDKSCQPFVYMVNIASQKTNLMNKTGITVAGIIHPDATANIAKGDFVLWGADNIDIAIPTGYILYKLKPIYNLSSNNFVFDQ